MLRAIPQNEARKRRSPESAVVAGRFISQIAALAAMLPAAALAASAGADADAYRAKMEKWVETRQILSEERAEWLVEKESLEATRELLQDERKALKEQIAALRSSDEGATQERDELTARREAYKADAEALEGRVRALEEQVRTLVPQLPEPLQKKLEPILVQIPTNPETTKVGLGQRLVNVLAVVAQAEKWNGTATFVGETRDIGNGQKVAVRTLYWGLAEAIYVDSQGEIAGVGRPSPEGWKFTDDPDLADSAKEILDIYEGIVDTIAFVPVPAEID
jgi:hypothetical protein